MNDLDTYREAEYHKTSSARSFGIVFAVVFLLLGLYPLLSGAPIRIWALLVGLVFGLSAWVAPQVLSPLSLAWAAFGHLLGKLTSPLFLGLVFFGLITPTGWFLRVFGRRPLSLDFDRKVPTYWIERSLPAPATDSMKDQF